MCVCVCVCVRWYACASFILLLMEETAASSLTTSGASIPCNSPTLHMHSVTDFLSFLLPSLPHPSPSSTSISPCSEARHRSCSTWLGCTGVMWATLGRPLSVTAVPSTCVCVSVMSGLWGSPLRRLGKLDDAVKGTRAALDVNFDEVCLRAWCVLVCISGASVDAYMYVHMCVCARAFSYCNYIRTVFRLRIHSIRSN